MSSTPLLIGLKLEQPQGTLRADIQVSCTNETTSQTFTDETKSDGKTIFNLGSTKNFSKGWNVGDIINVTSLYKGFEQKFSFTIPATLISIVIKDASDVTVGSFIGGRGMDAGILVLVAKVAAPSLK